MFRALTALLIVPVDAVGSPAMPDGLPDALHFPGSSGSVSGCTAASNAFRQGRQRRFHRDLRCLIADPTHVIAGLQIRLTIAAVLVLTAELTSLRSRPARNR